MPRATRASPAKSPSGGSASKQSPSKRVKVAEEADSTLPRMLRFYRRPAVDELELTRVLARSPVRLQAKDVESETCLYVWIHRELTEAEIKTILWLFGETYDRETASTVSTVGSANVVEVGPRLCYATPWASNALNIFASCGIDSTVISRVERSRRFSFPSRARVEGLLPLLYDRMTEQIYPTPLVSFVDQDINPTPEAVRKIPLVSECATIEECRAMLHKVSDELGLAFDEQDVDLYADLYRNQMKRDATDVELFDLAQSNSEHSRHWFFGGKMVFDGVEQPKTLFQMVKSTLTEKAMENSVIAFRDNSSAITGFPVKTLTPAFQNDVYGPSPLEETKIERLHGTLTAETHNFPTGVAPFPGAETGTGGRIRDVQCVGRGARVVAGTAAYCVGQLLLKGEQRLPWEDEKLKYPENLATPLRIEIEASNGASDYGNKFGEPCIAGHTRSFGQVLPDGSRREWIKPIMFTSGMGFMDARHERKGEAEPEMVVCKVGGPAYRIGMGGGAASSRVQDAKNADLDFNAVQRGDAEMENKMNRVIRACVEFGDKNPIHSIHDQGAGGNGNVLKEICEPKGGSIYLRRLPIGDSTMSARELWTAEYQENNAMLIPASAQKLVQSMCERELVPYAFVGETNDSGRVVVKDGVDDAAETVVDLSLALVLGKLPPKTFTASRKPKSLQPLKFPSDITIPKALKRVLRLLSVGSKRFLTNKVDRCVTGLVAQQQCVGPFHTPLADVAVMAQSLLPNEEGKRTGLATATGEQPIKLLIDPTAGARLSVAEALTNIMFAKVTKLSDVKCRANWMWAAKLDDEAADMYDACRAICEVLIATGVGMDGGKDSLSMAAKVDATVVKAPGQVAISVYGMVPDISLTVTPDLKPFGEGSVLLYVGLGGHALAQGKLGGSALAQVYSQLGNECSDLVNPAALVSGFEVVQSLLEKKQVLAGHDVSDGGVLVATLEMAFAGNASLDLAFTSTGEALNVMFGEEPGCVLQVRPADEQAVLAAFAASNVECLRIGRAFTLSNLETQTIKVSFNGEQILDSTTAELRDIWESTSFALEELQCNPSCTAQEKKGLSKRVPPPYKLSFESVPVPRPITSTRPKIAILREEGSNGDREMACAFHMVGFEAWDISMNDLRHQRASLKQFRGIAFVGGFSYADVFGSAKGWGAAAMFHPIVKQELDEFRERKDTFSFGACNGCQLMALLGWVPSDESTQLLPPASQPRFVHNESKRFESRFASVEITKDTPAVMLKGMEGSVLGVWVAHGEGRAVFPDEKVWDHVNKNNLAALKYVDDQGQPTQAYPLNPNGSAHAVAGLCSTDGRHLAMMPHPERTFELFQWPWTPMDWKDENSKVKASPWQRMFRNAYDWCVSTA